MSEIGQEVAVANPTRELISQVRGDKFKQEVAAALEGGPVTEAKFVRATITALMQNPELAEADPDSLFASVIKCATDGLLPDGREAALVIFNSKVKGPDGDVWVKKVQYMPMIGGFRKIAADHGWAIRTDVVYEKDEFEYELGLDPKLVHRPAPLRTDRGKLIYAYAIGTHKDGRKEIEVMGSEEIGKLRAVSKSAERGPWKDWEDRMWEKSVGRRLFAKLPLDRREDSRIEQMLEATKENAADLLYGPDGHAHPVTPALPMPADAPTAAAPPDGADAANPPGDDQAPGSDRGDQQADGAATEGPASSVPDPDEEAEPQVGGAAAAFPIPEKAIDEAAATVIPKGDDTVRGKPLATVAAEEDGDKWLAWALRTKPAYWSQTFRVSLELFVEHRCPEIWTAFVAEREAAA